MNRDIFRAALCGVASLRWIASFWRGAFGLRRFTFLSFEFYNALRDVRLLTFLFDRAQSLYRFIELVEPGVAIGCAIRRPHLHLGIIAQRSEFLINRKRQLVLAARIID